MMKILCDNNRSKHQQFVIECGYYAAAEQVEEDIIYILKININNNKTIMYLCRKIKFKRIYSTKFKLFLMYF